MPHAAQRYSAIAIVLHWAIAIAIIGNIALGWWMHRAIDVPQTQARAIAVFQLHKSIGLTILVLSLLRLCWRLVNPPPPLPAHMRRWEKHAARATHWAFYVLMIAIPLSGWLYVSAQWRHGAPLNIQTLWFGLFTVPHLFGLNEAAQALRQCAAGIAFEVHWLLAWGTAGLLVLHVVAALKHHFIDRDTVLAQMVPALAVDDAPSAQPRARKATLWVGFASIAVAVAAIGIPLISPPASTGGASPKSAAKTAPAAPGDWVVDRDQSAVEFSGRYGGSAFQGRFKRWRADIRIDAADPTQSRIAATIETGSATDGTPLHDKTLTQTEWFDVARYPVSTYHATRIRKRDDKTYAVSGVLAIKDNDIPVPPLTLTLDGDDATILGQFTVDRRAANLGMESDPDAQWVSREITVKVRVVLSRAS